MPFLHIIILALIQGVTEFLPISSSGHLVLAQAFLNPGQNWTSHIVIDVAVHIGTLLSVLLYFRHDVIKMLCGLKKLACKDTKAQESKLLLHVVIGSIPVIIAGFIINRFEPDWMLSITIVAWTTLIFGIVLWLADRFRPAERTIDDMNLKHAILIGLAQVLALIPGTSRSGITMTMGRALGYKRTESAHFSLLLGIIAISGAGLLSGITMIEKHILIEALNMILLAAFLAFISGYIAIALMMKWLERCSFTPFAIYRVILGILLLGFIYWPGA